MRRAGFFENSRSQPRTFRIDLNKAFWVTACLVFFISSSLGLRADDQLLPGKAAGIVAGLREAGARGKDLRNQSPEAISARFTEAFSFLREVAASILPERQKSELVVKVALAAAEAFDEITEPFEDPVLLPSEHRLNRLFVLPEGRFGEAMSWIGSRVNVALGTFVRDLKSIAWTWDDDGRPRLPTATPFIGEDSRRTRMIARIAKELQRAFDEEAVQVQKNLSEKKGIAGLSLLVEKLGASEPMRFGPHHRLVRRAYIGLAVLTFFHPLVEPFLTRTTFGPLVAGTFWMGSFLYVAHARRVSSGLGFFEAVNRLKKNAAFLSADECEKILNSR